MHCKRLCTVPFHFRGKLTFMVNYGKKNCVSLWWWINQSINLCLGRRFLVSLEMPDSIQKQLFKYFVPFSFPEKVLHFPSNTFLKILNVWLLPFMQMQIYFSRTIALKVLIYSYCFEWYVTFFFKHKVLLWTIRYDDTM